jgi:hypothetical protein
VFLERLLDPPTQLAVDLAIQALKDIGALQHDGQNLLNQYNFLIIAAALREVF